MTRSPRMRGGGRTAALFAAGLLVVSTAARGDSTSPGGLRGLLRVRSADTAGRGMLEVGAFAGVHTLLDAQDSRHYLLVSNLQLGYGLSDYVEIGIDQPVRAWYVSRSSSSRIEPTNHAGFGDVLASAKLHLPIPWRTLRLGALGVASFPSGNRDLGYSSESADLEVGGLLTLDFTHLERFLPTRLHLNGGYRWNRNESIGIGLAALDHITAGGFWPPAYPATPAGAQVNYNDQLLWRAGVEFSTRVLALFTEFALDDYPNVPGTAWRDNPVMLTQGALLKFRNGLNLKAAVDVSLQRDTPPPTLPHLPDWRFTLGLTWRAGLTLGDRDHDGIPDKRDRCPDQAEDFDGYQDEDGCPDLDNDADGVPDKDDLAPDLPEDRDGFEDQDGRPDLDNDGDGIPDKDDHCRDDPEDFDGDRDTDGCPDADTPGAQVSPAPSPSPAPEQPAPQPGVAAPAAPRPGASARDSTGMAPALARAGILQGLWFTSGSDELPPGSGAALAPLLAEMRAHPELGLELRGYTDGNGHAGANQELSQRRAEAVRGWFLAQGIAAERVQARGRGSADPIAANDTAEGRARNRRIEYALH